MSALYIGIDWSKDNHDVAFVNAAGVGVARYTIPHSQVGFETLLRACQELKVTPDAVCVSIETKHNLLVDYLWSYGFNQVYIIAPSLVKAYRQRYSHSGAHTDATDAFMLADILRTDQHRLTLWQPDSALTRELRVTVSELQQLTRQVVMLSNQLQARLLRYYPGVLDVFPNLTCQTPAALVIAYPTPAAIAAVTPEAFEEFLRQQRYPHVKVTLGGCLICSTRRSSPRRRPPACMPRRRRPPPNCCCRSCARRPKPSAAWPSSLRSTRTTRSLLRSRAPATCSPQRCWRSSAMTASVSLRRPVCRR